MPGASAIGSRRLRRLVLWLIGLLALAAAASPGASAHVGEPVSVVRDGPYRLAITALPVRAGSRVALAFHASLGGAGSGVAPAVRELDLSVATATGAALGTYRASGYGGTYSLLVPIPSANSWRTLRFELRIAGQHAAFTARYQPPSLLGDWPLDPVPLAGAAVALVLFLQGFVRLRRRGRRDRASVARLVIFGLGLVALVGPLVSPLDPVGDGYLLSGHMLQHVLIGDLAPALLLLALRGPLLFFVVPRPLLRRLGRSQPLRRTAAWLVRPRVAIGAWALAFGCWHIPAVYDYAATHQVVHDIEHATFVAVGLLLWSLLLDPSGRLQLSRGKKLGLAAAVFAMGTVVSDLLIFSLHPLYGLYAGQPERVFALSPLRDQQLAGLVMTVEQIVTLGTFAVVTLVPVLRSARRGGGVLAGRERLA